MYTSTDELREIVAGIVETSPDEDLSEQYAQLVRGIVRSYMSRQRVFPRLRDSERERICGQVVEDLLGRRSARGFSDVRSYYEVHAWSEVTDPVLWSITRRLVRGAACDALLFYRWERDDLFRNRTRLITDEVRKFEPLMVEGGDYPEISVVRQTVNSPDPAPSWSLEVFESYLWLQTDQTFELSLIFGGVADVLRSSETYRPAVPASMLALICKS